VFTLNDKYAKDKAAMIGLLLLANDNLSQMQEHFHGFFPPNLPDFSEQLAECDDRLFNKIHLPELQSATPPA